MTLPPEVFSTPRAVEWRSRGPSQLVLETRGEFEVPSGVLLIGDAAREEFVHEHSATLDVPKVAAEVELAVVYWDDDDAIKSGVAAVTLWFRSALPEVEWIRHLHDAGMDSGVGLLVEASETDQAIAPLSAQDIWPSIGSSIAKDGVVRIGPALLFDGGPGLGDLPVWVGRGDEGDLVAVRISTRLLDDSLLFDGS